MSLKSLIWTTAVAVVIFFIAIYLGMKYDWVQNAEPKLPTSDRVKQTDATGSVSLGNSNPLKLGKHEQAPALIDEPPEADTSPISLGSTDLAIEDIVAQCQALTQSVGIPKAQEEQSMMECINRNSTHLSQETTELSEKNKLIQEQCDIAITQRELLSEEEVKMLLDECIAAYSN